MLQPPKAQQRPKTYHYHDDVLIDSYAWLRNRDNPEVLEYLSEENKFTEAYMKPTKKLQEDLFNEMRSRIKLTDSTVPCFEENYYYYWRTTETEEYQILCRREKEMSATEEIILNENEMAKGFDYFNLGDHDISPNQRYVAYTIDTEGNEAYTLHIKDLQTQTSEVTSINQINDNIFWANDNKTLFFIKLDTTWRPFAVYSYDIETKKTRLYYTEEDATFWLGLDKSKTKEFILLQSCSKTTTEVHYLPAANPDTDFTCLYPREEGVKYSAEPHLHDWYITTNLHAKNFRIVKAPMNDLNPIHWQEIIAHHPEIKIEDVEIFHDFLAYVERHQAQLHIRVYELNSKKNQILAFPEDIYTVHFHDNIDFNSSTLRVVYTSLTTPTTTYDVNLYTHDRIMLKQAQVLGDFHINDYHCERLYAESEDGTMIPISLVYHRNTLRNGSAPLYLYGYGSYGHSLDPWFSSSRLSLLNRGIIFAIAHIRGGGDNGEYWYDAGKLLQKKHTFIDFIACAKHLITKNYTQSNKLIIAGGSAGGLLIGAVLNQCPDLCAIAIAHVPFVDVINTMMDPSIPLTTGEYKEWGNPEIPEFYYYIKSYSPYDNVSHQHYPALLVTAGLSDPRVQYWEPAKWVAKLREYKTDKNILLLKTNMTAGHQGASGRFATLKEVAFEYAFILHLLGNQETSWEK